MTDQNIPCPPVSAVDPQVHDNHQAAHENVVANDALIVSAKTNIALIEARMANPSHTDDPKTLLAELKAAKTARDDALTMQPFLEAKRNATMSAIHDAIAASHGERVAWAFSQRLKAAQRRDAAVSEIEAAGQMVATANQVIIGARQANAAGSFDLNELNGVRFVPEEHRTHRARTEKEEVAFQKSIGRSV